jgi:hypothetical protein
MQSYALAKALTDSGKLLALDQLLEKLKVEGHRVLIFCQVRLGNVWQETFVWEEGGVWTRGCRKVAATGAILGLCSQ